MKKLLIVSVAIAAATVMASQANAATYIQLSDGRVVPKNECTDGRRCADCTFLDAKTCYDQADKLGLIDHNIGFGLGQRPPLYSNRKEEPMEWECGKYMRDLQSLTLPYGKGEIICPVLGATPVAPPPPKVVVAAPYFPAQSVAGNSAVGIFFTQHCPGYITEAERQLIHTVSQFNAREAWSMVNDIETNMGIAARANQTSPREELFNWCIAAEPRIADIKSKLGKQMLE
jgi:hypothetical protein